MFASNHTCKALVIKLSNCTQIIAIQLLLNMINGANMQTQLADLFSKKYWIENDINNKSQKLKSFWFQSIQDVEAANYNVAVVTYSCHVYDGFKKVMANSAHLRCD